MKLRMLASALAMLAATPAAAAVLTTGAGDGSVNLTVNGGGAFGGASAASAVGTTDAIYDPIGATAAAGTTFESYVYLRTGGSGARTNLGLVDAVATGGSATQGSSTFSVSGLDFSLLQNVSALFDSGNARTGSLLTQAFTFTNTTGGDLMVELTRYLDGDLQFDGSNADGGGRLILDGREVLFETDAAIGSANSNTFIGIYNEGGATLGYEVDGYSDLRSRIENGVALDNLIAGDGGDADQFIDTGPGYDVTLGLGRSFTLAAGQSATFTTGTIFGSGAPDDVVVPTPAVPEPATWAMMMLGFGLVGAAARRRRPLVLA